MAHETQSDVKGTGRGALSGAMKEAQTPKPTAAEQNFAARQAQTIKVFEYGGLD